MRRRILPAARSVVLIGILAAVSCQGELWFNPLPVPQYPTYPAIYQVQEVSGVQDVLQVGPHFDIVYGEADQAFAFETIQLFNKINSIGVNPRGTMRQSQFGDWVSGNRRGPIRVVEYYDTSTNLVAGMVELRIQNWNILQLIRHGFGSFRSLIDRSRLNLVYTRKFPGGPHELTKIVYQEVWGFGNEDRLAMGQTALWEDNLQAVVPPRYRQWGFWETGTLPFDLVKGAIDSVRDALADGAVPPTLQIEDEDKIGDLIGRQAGAKLYRHGEPWGSIDFHYRQIFGRMPNVPSSLINQKGFLSRIDWDLGGKMYSLAVLSPKMSTVPASLMVFAETAKAGDLFRAMEMEQTSWPTLYPKLRNGEFPGVILALHVWGRVDGIWAPGKDGSAVKVGNGGQIQYSILGAPSNENVRMARSLLALMGQGGIIATGFYFPYKQGSGNGVDFYLAAVTLASSQNGVPVDDRVLNEFGLDIGVLDRVGMPELDVIDHFRAISIP
ncbi:MAG: hypothetical protein HYY16_13445 [Planctomycetes bacterium]|nr:hypothetical protein [Planctomycetota bacterium]